MKIISYVCIIAVIILIVIGLVALVYTPTTTLNEKNEKVEGFLNYVKIDEFTGRTQVHWLAYDKTNMICYDIINPKAVSRSITPHIIVENGVAFLSMYKDGEIIPVPFGVMSGETIKNWFN